MPERGPPVAVARCRGRRTRGLIALVAALTLLALAGVSASAGAVTVAQQLASLPTIQPFNAEATSLSQFGSRWSAFHFAVEKGTETSRGWSPAWAYPNVNGAFYSTASYTAAYGGVAAVATMAVNPETQSRYFSLWVDATDEVGGRKSGYELRFTFTAEETYTVELMKWATGVQTVLASQRNVTFNEGNAFAIVDQGGTVSAWSNTGSGFTQLLTASDTAFNSGSVGLSAASNFVALTAFKAGQLAPAAPSLTRTNPASGADNNSPFVIGTATSGTTVNLYTSATCRGSPVATGTAASLAASGLQVRVADNTTTDFYASATDNLSNVSDCSAGISYTERTASGIGGALASLPQLDAFATAENPLSGGGRWTQLSWARHPGRVAGSGTSGGWGPYNAFPTVHGAYWNPTSFADAGDGVAVAATLSISPSATERYFSLWLGMSEPGRAQSGYELRFTNVNGANSYDVTLSKWVSGTTTVLARQSGYTLAPQSSFALVDVGGTVSAWIDSGAGYGQLLSASDSTYSRGHAGIEGAGNITRVRQFRAGALSSETGAMLANQPVVEAFATEQFPLSGGGRWTQLSWASHPGWVSGSGTFGGWGPWEAFPTVHGAYWNPTTYGDGGSGAAVAATLSVSPELTERWFSLWLDMPEPGRAQSGYELRFTQTATANTYDVTLSKWVSGTRTVLARQSGYAFALQRSFALVDIGGTVSAWIDSGAGFAQLLSASDSTYSRGHAGIEGAGNITRIRNFRASGS
ncbi:MAG TPA: hypothetical protein VK506_10955 [Conexibacter sp.]|nr:hypothetical protein [Conexibacter sp.]